MRLEVCTKNGDHLFCDAAKTDTEYEKNGTLFFLAKDDDGDTVLAVPFNDVAWARYDYDV